MDAIWLSPFFDSPRDDLGYDIINMRKVDPLFGDLQDFDRLVELAHTLGIKVIIDQVWNHTSDRHPWFQESRSSRDNPKANWYVWADAQEDGSPPNNWMSAFMGKSAWQWDRRREQYYFYNFLPSQPDLNWHNPQVREAVLTRARYWLDRGIDGIRLDAPNFFTHDPQLRDNPPRPKDAPLPDGVAADNPIVGQQFVRSFCRPETLELLKPIRELIERYPNVMTLAEVTFCDDSVALAGEYVAGKERLHMAYHSGLLTQQAFTAEFMADLLSRVVKHFPGGGACWIVGNHDYGRLRTQWGSSYPDEFYHLAAALLLSLPGAFCLYQGDELGLEEATIPEDIPADEIKDPFGKALYPDVPGRDGSRTPMPWQKKAPHGGFTTAEKPWLPVPDRHRVRAVDAQLTDPNSLLNTWRRLLHWRKQQPALEAGKLKQIDADDAPILAFVREYAEQTLLCVFNISDRATVYDLSRYGEYNPVLGLHFPFRLDGDALELPPYGVFFANLDGF